MSTSKIHIGWGCASKTTRARRSVSCTSCRRRTLSTARPEFRASSCASATSAGAKRRPESLAMASVRTPTVRSRRAERQPEHRLRGQRTVQLERLRVRGGVAKQRLGDFDHLGRRSARTANGSARGPYSASARTTSSRVGSRWAPATKRSAPSSAATWMAHQSASAGTSSRERSRKISSNCRPELRMRDPCSRTRTAARAPRRPPGRAGRLRPAGPGHGVATPAVPAISVEPPTTTRLAPARSE